MSEQNTEGTHQDPAEPKHLDSSVDTSDQEVTPEAPVAAEPAPVTVAPADQSEPKQANLLGKDYEVTPDRGYRQVQTPPPSDGGDNEDSSDSES